MAWVKYMGLIMANGHGVKGLPSRTQLSCVFGKRWINRGGFQVVTAQTGMDGRNDNAGGWVIRRLAHSGKPRLGEVAR
jgi:hypothetical protein